MDKFIECNDCKCLVNKQCRRKSAVHDIRGYGTWPEMKSKGDGCFDGKVKATRLSDMIAKQEIKDEPKVS